MAEAGIRAAEATTRRQMLVIVNKKCRSEVRGGKGVLNGTPFSVALVANPAGRRRKLSSPFSRKIQCSEADTKLCFRTGRLGPSTGIVV